MASEMTPQETAAHIAAQAQRIADLEAACQRLHRLADECMVERDAARGELAQIVAWMRSGAIYRHPAPPNVALFNRLADAIEAGQHKGNG